MQFLSQVSFGKVLMLGTLTQTTVGRPVVPLAEVHAVSARRSTHAAAPTRVSHAGELSLRRMARGGKPGEKEVTVSASFCPSLSFRLLRSR